MGKLNNIRRLVIEEMTAKEKQLESIQKEINNCRSVYIRRIRDKNGKLEYMYPYELKDRPPVFKKTLEGIKTSIISELCLFYNVLSYLEQNEQTKKSR